MRVCWSLPDISSAGGGRQRDREGRGASSYLSDSYPNEPKALRFDASKWQLGLPVSRYPSHAEHLLQSHSASFASSAWGKRYHVHSPFARLYRRRRARKIPPETLVFSSRGIDTKLAPYCWAGVVLPTSTLTSFMSKMMVEFAGMM